MSNRFISMAERSRRQVQSRLPRDFDFALSAITRVTVTSGGGSDGDGVMGFRRNVWQINQPLVRRVSPAHLEVTAMPDYSDHFMHFAPSGLRG